MVALRFTRDRRLISIVTIALLLAPSNEALAAGQVAVSSLTSSNVLVSSEDLAESRRFRTEFGLPSDEASIQAAYTSAAPDYSFGVALTSSEAAELAARDEIRELLDEPIRIASESSAFGGALIDQSAGGALVIFFTSETDSAREAVVDALPAKAAVRWQLVERTYSDLAAERDSLVETVQADEFIRDRLAAIDISVSENAVIMSIDLDPTTVKARLGDALKEDTVVKRAERSKPAACPSRLNCTPWRGGIKIVNSTGTTGCTYGFNVRRLTDNAKLMLTAGHCGNSTWRHNGSNVGTTTINNLTTPGVALGDFQVAPLIVANTPLNLVYATDQAPAREITSYRAYAQQLEGDGVCAAGYTSNYRCGTITNSDRYYCIGYFGTKCMWGKQASYPSAPGDSGGPAHYLNTALGIVSAIDGSSTVYSAIDHTESAVNAFVCRNASCTT